jgi:heme oxygenase
VFCESVKSATARLHEQAESSPFISLLMSGRLNVRSYARYVQALQPVYQVLEETMRGLEDPIVGVFDHRGLDRSDRMIADLSTFGLPAFSRGSSATNNYCAAILASAAEPHRILAHHYTRYLGDMAGGQAISRLMQRHYNIDPRSLTFYDFAALGDTHHYRKQYKNLLDLLAWSPTEQAEYIAESQLAYQLNIELFDELGRICGVLPRTGSSGNDFFASEKAHSVTQIIGHN